MTPLTPKVRHTEATLTSPGFAPPPPVPGHAPAAPRRPAPVAATLAVLLAVLLTAAGIVVAGRAGSDDGPAAPYLSGRPVTRTHAGVQPGAVWQVSQGSLPAAETWRELSLLARRQLAAPPAGRWLTVDVLGPLGARASLDFEIADGGLLLRAVTTIERSLVFDPGVPVITADLVQGRTAQWSGRLGRNADQPGTAAAQIRATADSPAGCLTSTIELGADTQTLTFCQGADAGLAGWTDASSPGRAGFTPARATQPATGAPGSSGPPAAVRGGEVRAVRFLRQIAGSYREQLAPFGSRVAWAGERLLIADTEGRLTSWQPVDDTGRNDSLYAQAWRTQPGGSVRAIATVGALTVVGTTEREVIAYDHNGWQLWRAGLDDAVVQLAVAAGNVAVLDAGGELRVLRADSGAEVWTGDGVDQLFGAASSGALIVAGAGELTVLDAATGDQRWSVEADPRAVEAVGFGSSVAMLDGNWLVVRAAANGAVAWTRTVPNATVLYPAGLSSAGTLLISEPHRAELVDEAGGRLWVSDGDLPVVVPVRGSGQVIGVTDTELLLAGVGSPTRRWAYPAGARRPELAPLRTQRGVLTMQLIQGRFEWREYR